mmetsp:Transcript_787/g.1356  ORF Transcript_787/g.1356 Transcript_787/m.1356 type:complete len:408 (-) Transcript_787:228-1451(-)
MLSCFGDAKIMSYTAPKKGSFQDQTVTLLDRHFNYVIPIVLILFIVLMIACGLENAHDPNPVCNDSSDLEVWVDSAMAAAAGCAVLTCTLQAIRIISIFRSKAGNRNAPLIRVNAVLFVLNFVSGVAKIMTLFFHFGGICRDKFGVYSPGDQWVEWLILVPLLNYVACAVEQKTELDRFDTVMLVLLTLMIFFGFLLHIDGPLGMHVFFLACSFLCLIGVTVMSIHNYYQVKEKYGRSRVRISNYFPIKQTQRKALLLVQLNIILWYYPAVWFLGAIDALDINYTFAAYMLGSMFGKIIFSSLVIESHVNLLFEFLVKSAAHSNLADDAPLEKSVEKSAERASLRHHDSSSTAGIASGVHSKVHVAASTTASESTAVSAVATGETKANGSEAMVSLNDEESSHQSPV